MGMGFPEMARRGADDMGPLKAFFELNPFLKKSRGDAENE